MAAIVAAAKAQTLADADTLTVHKCLSSGPR
jgi:hypothetical protein